MFLSLQMISPQQTFLKINYIYCYQITQNFDHYTKKYLKIENFLIKPDQESQRIQNMLLVASKPTKITE